MANQKISQLTASTTPLAGTEVLPIVQSSVTKQVSVANLTTGRSVAMSGYTVTNTATDVDVLIRNLTAAGTSGETTGISFDVANNAAGVRIYARRDGTYASAATRDASFRVATTLDAVESEKFVFTSNGDLVISTAARGIDFSANTPLAGKTSTILNWYEEGTWTPNQGADLTLVGAFSSTGRYTRIGRQVSISGTVTGATSVAVTAAGVITSNLPFTVVTAGHGDATNVAVNASATVICTSTNVTSAAAIAATATITFSATYFV